MGFHAIDCANCITSGNGVRARLAYQQAVGYGMSDSDAAVICYAVLGKMPQKIEIGGGLVMSREIRPLKGEIFFHIKEGLSIRWTVSTDSWSVDIFNEVPAYLKDILMSRAFGS